MNKIVFPALLAATIMVAGAFAFMPVEQASTVHQSVATLEDQTKMITISDTCTAVSVDDCDTVDVDVVTGASYEILSIYVTEVDTDTSGADVLDFAPCTIDGVASALDPADASGTTVADFATERIAAVGVNGNDFSCEDTAGQQTTATDVITVRITMVLDADTADPSITLSPEG